ncbi:hypothetical protein HL667_11655 [Bradyrhizobium sp. 83012]|uniref:Uncharacterized protein n=1 Tax=Bradyrhizobium aeschynomenes TaxID=2734909 RepID=A0ABX2CEI9_9BRAD|nr:hypothetical protein [Bradyrhizobium aeschynomenes]NPU09916.1 hypothetical protein [Bradyrhizobium aeschynomenes]NPU65652.1 hypothetical protein [Bradyrhizobium aeschynomenes]NPV23522.1 hypothetical protein [Bradyrhizobium aeschynomenes]
MTETEKAEQVVAALRSAEASAPEAALQTLNGLMGLVRSPSAEQPLEVEEARAAAFMSICEVGKALHRKQPTEALWPAAVSATERWLTLVK